MVEDPRPQARRSPWCCVCVRKGSPTVNQGQTDSPQTITRIVKEAEVDVSNPEPQEEKKLTHDPRYHWDREEHIILLDAYLRYRPQFPSSESNEIQEISRLLRQYHPQKGNTVHEKLRNGDGVYMKMMNFRRFDPTTESKGLPKGNKLEEIIWNEYYDRQEELKATAELIKRSIKDGTSFPDNDHLDEPEMESEGRVIGTIHKRHERSNKNKENKINDIKNKNTRVT